MVREAWKDWSSIAVHLGPERKSMASVLLYCTIFIHLKVSEKSMFHLKDEYINIYIQCVCITYMNIYIYVWVTVALDLRRECLHATKNQTYRILKYGNCTFRTTVCGIRWSIRKVATGDVLHDAGQPGVMFNPRSSYVLCVQDLASWCLMLRVVCALT